MNVNPKRYISNKSEKTKGIAHWNACASCENASIIQVRRKPKRKGKMSYKFIFVILYFLQQFSPSCITVTCDSSMSHRKCSEIKKIKKLLIPIAVIGL